ncbi:MAG: Hsp20/alpha crystallin family protein [Acidobacteriota bacterium]
MPGAKLDPYRELAIIKERMNRLFESAMGRTEFGSEGGGVSWTPRADIYETDNEIIVNVEIPGVPRDAFEVRMADNTLILEGKRPPEKGLKEEAYHRVECSCGPFVRRFSLPASVSVDQVKARYERGVLSVRLPKIPSARPRHIKLTVDASS